MKVWLRCLKHAPRTGLKCTSSAMALTTASIGFSGVLSLHAICGVRILSSHMEPDADRWRVDFPSFLQSCGHGCATCKPAMMSLLNRSGAPTIFVGDGLSDKYAAASADFVFAKDKLAAYCQEQQIAHSRYNNLSEVAERLLYRECAIC